MSIYITRRQAEALAAAAKWAIDKRLADRPPPRLIREALRAMSREGVRGAAS